MASEFDLRQVEAQTAQALALLPAFERSLAQQETALAVLLGRSPRTIVTVPVERGAAIDALTVPPAVPAGLPSDILERRPDVRQAEQQLIAANARIGQAKAAYFPSISLTAFLGSDSASLSDLFSASARVWQVGGSAAQTVFDAGRTGEQVEQARAREQQLLARYASAIQNAFKDTLDALVARRTAREALDAEQERVAALQTFLQTGAIALRQRRFQPARRARRRTRTSGCGTEPGRSTARATRRHRRLVQGSWAEVGMEYCKWRNPPTRTEQRAPCALRTAWTQRAQRQGQRTQRNSVSRRDCAQRHPFRSLPAPTFHRLPGVPDGRSCTGLPPAGAPLRMACRLALAQTPPIIGGRSHQHPKKAEEI